ncbi:hypothetical protein CLOM_g12044 [Closterium sp. NIES-68]|nr:hypothetical protein CLOM_g12044 [Closterium sp. NIES-68]
MPANHHTPAHQHRSTAGTSSRVVSGSASASVGANASASLKANAGLHGSGCGTGACGWPHGSHHRHLCLLLLLLRMGVWGLLGTR